ncbi:MAG: type II toxin-antitoxin system RelB/DinJ family antitoxin [Clostridia bacterium]|nr:type II toxin-antitoxin system RelB/DinJ family antitoxin [Clostridia bacterium]
MAKTATVHVRMDEQIKEDALGVFESLGISVADAITMYFRQVALKNGIPFELTAEKKPRNNFERVSEYKREDLEKVLEVLPESIDELWVFGSAITEYCRPDSDLDVCIVGDNISKEDRRTLAHAPRYGMDLLDISHDDFAKESREKGSIYNEIKTKGLLIYKKGIGLINGKI